VNKYKKASKHHTFNAELANGRHCVRRYVLRCNLEYFLFTVVVLAFCSQVHAGDCFVTQECEDARTEVYFKARDVHTAYNECGDLVQAALYWKALAACPEEGFCTATAGGCAHLLSNGS
jgi:hypothetical protein